MDNVKCIINMKDDTKMKKVFLWLTAILLLPINLFSQPTTNHQSLITIRDAWIRPAAANANSAFFFEVVNNGSAADTLLSANGDLSEIVEIHETYKRESDMMGMREVHNVPIPAKSTVKFKPGALHVMLIGLTKDVRPGEQYDLILQFKNAGTKKVKAVVRDMPRMK